MNYPDNFEKKIGIEKIREYAASYCMYDPGKEEIRSLKYSSDYKEIRYKLLLVEEFRQILESDKVFPVETFIDIAPSVKKLRIEGNFLDEEELFSIKKVLESIRSIFLFFKNTDELEIPGLISLSSEVKSFPVVIEKLNLLLNKFGKIKDSASKELQEIRREKNAKEHSVSRILNKILEKARNSGVVEDDAVLAIRNGRSVIPVPGNNKKRIAGYIHDESATGKTFYIEPLEVVEVNNEVRELELREKREIIRLLIEITDFLRPYRDELEDTHNFLARIDSIRARAKFAQNIGAILPRIENKREVDWHNAVHPVLLLSFREMSKEKDVVPLDIHLDQKNRILIISGPNAGGKSVCLQTLGILQTMLQTGFLVPVSESSVFGIFDEIFLDMGDEQSIEDDLSTYSSHLLNMKYFTRNSGSGTLLLIDEFGSGTEPSLGGAIAESVLEKLNISEAFGLITTHYTNLKHFASQHDGLINGAMLYDTGQMKPLFRLAIGRPGSSFAFEIARKIGLQEDILKSAEEKIGQDQVKFDKALKDLIRDKKYWENKRQRIRLAEKRLSELVERYDHELADTEKLRKRIINEAKEQATVLLSGTNKKIENTIREIREAEAEKEKTRELRKDIEVLKSEVSDFEVDEDKKRTEAEELKKKIQEIKLQNERIRKKNQGEKSKPEKSKVIDTTIRIGDQVKMKSQDVPGQVLEISGKNICVAFGHLKTWVKKDQLEKLAPGSVKQSSRGRINLGEWDIGKRKINFSPDIDVRGKRADEALRIIAEFIDEAIMVQSHDLRILHGKGNGILRELIRQQLSVINVVGWYGDEHVERGGAGITIVKLNI